MIVDRGRGLRQLIGESLPTLATLFAWDIVVVLGFQLLHRPWMDQPTLPYALIGSALALFLGARNTGASGRWWEARTLWGAAVNGSRTLARQRNTLLGGTRCRCGRSPPRSRSTCSSRSASRRHHWRRRIGECCFRRRGAGSNGAESSIGELRVRLKTLIGRRRPGALPLDPVKGAALKTPTEGWSTGVETECVSRSL